MTRPAPRLPAILLTLLLLTPVAVAQGGIYGNEVDLETDPFTGEESCTHFIADSESDGDLVFAFMPRIDEVSPTIAIGYTVNWRDLIYDEYIIPEDDRVLMRIGDDIHRLPAGASWYDPESDEEVVVAEVSYSLLRDLANAREPVPVRLESDYSGLQYDYTMPMRMLEIYRDGFARICLP